MHILGKLHCVFSQYARNLLYIGVLLRVGQFQVVVTGKHKRLTASLLRCQTHKPVHVDVVSTLYLVCRLYVGSV